MIAMAICIKIFPTTNVSGNEGKERETHEKTHIDTGFFLEVVRLFFLHHILPISILCMICEQSNNLASVKIEWNKRKNHFLEMGI